MPTYTPTNMLKLTQQGKQLERLSTVRIGGITMPMKKMASFRFLDRHLFVAIFSSENCLTLIN